MTDPINNLVNSKARQAAYDKYFAEYIAKDADAYHAALMAYDDVKMDVKNGRLE